MVVEPDHDSLATARFEKGFEHDDRASGTCSPSEHAARVFACNVCFGDAVEPVVTQCGHLYCWKCLYRWAQAPRTASCAPWCPVCNAQLDLSHVVPIYTRGGALEEDAALASSGDSDLMDDEELAIPPRPKARRPPTVRMDAIAGDLTLGLAQAMHMRELAMGLDSSGSAADARLAMQRGLLLVGCVLISMVLCFL